MRVATLLVPVVMALAASPATADTLLVNARIHTMDEQRPEATAMAWSDDGMLLAVGDGADLQARFPEAARVDANGAVVVPGLIDAHGHMLDLGAMLSRANLVGAATKAEAIDRLRTFARDLPDGAWLLGYGWDQNDWPGHEFPDAADLDAAFPDRPVYLDRVDGHAAWVNSAAMQLATRALDGDWQPEGGQIRRVQGKPTGILIDGATALVAAAIPTPSDAEREAAYKAAFARAVANGLTGVHDAGIDLADFRLLQKLAERGEIPLRLYEMARGKDTLEWLCGEHGHWRDPSGRLRMQAIKLFIDGALGSRGAELLADYSDEPGNHGLFVTDPETYRGLVEQAHACGVQVNTHAIGDGGNRVVLDTYAAVLGEDAIYSDHRWRVEHAQIVARDDLPRFAALHLIASMQPTHATSDMPWAEQRLGKDRLYGAYAWQRMLKQGVPLAFGSDFPVEDVNPMLGLYAAVTRQDLDGQPPGGWLPDQRVSRKQALAGFTRGAAYASFMEDEVGQLKRGLRADFVILDADPMTVAPRAIADIKPRSTWVDGKAVYRAPSAP